MKKTPIFFAALLLAAAPLFSQNKGVTPVNQSLSQLTGQTRAVVVGISDYQEKDIPDLRFADKDALAFANFLRSPGGGSLSTENLRILTNQQATAGQVISALTWLLEESKPGDQAIIYFSGHGDVEAKLLNQLGFLLLWDSPAHLYLAGALPVDMLRQVVSTLSIEMKTRVFVVVDACRAGKLAGNTVIGTQLTSSQLAQQFSQEQKILSCQPNEFSIEGEQWGGGRGVFSYHLCNGLYGLADGDHDGQVSLFEIGRYLEDRVPKDVAPLSQLPLTVGDKSGALFSVDGPTLAALEKQGVPPAVIAGVEQRGMVQEVLAKADTSVRFWYAGFERTLRGKNFFQPDGDCVEFYFQKLLVTESIAALHPALKRNYAAALQDDAQQTLNTWLKTSQEASFEAVATERLTKKVLTEKIRTFPRCLDRAAELLGSKHYMYAALKARQYFFEGFLLANFNKNLNTELGGQALALFRQSLGWQPEQPQVYWQMSKVYGWNFLQPDSLEYYARRAMEIYPNWTRPCLDAAFWLSFKYKQQQRARPFLEQASRIDSSSAEVLHRWAIFNFGEKNYAEAEQQLKKAIALDSASATTWNNLAYLYIETRRYAEAEQVLKKSIALDSTVVSAWDNLGRLYSSRTRRYAEAEQAYKKAIALDSMYASAWHNLGGLYTDTRRYAEAEPVLKKAIALDSTFASVWNNLGVMYLHTRRYAEAEPVLKKSIALDSTFASAWNNLGVMYLHTRRYAEAEPVLKKSIALDSTDASVWNNLGAVYNMTSRYAEAEPVLKKTIALDSTVASLWNELGVVYNMTRRYTKAEPVLKKAIALDSTNATVWNNLGFAYNMTSRFSKAEPVLKKAIALDSTNATAWSNLGFAYLNTRRYAEAEAVLKKAIALDSTYSGAWDILGQLYNQTRRYTEAEQVNKKAIALDSTNAWAWGNLGNLYYQTRRWAEAEPVFKKAIALDSTNATVWGNLGDLYFQTLRYAEAEPVLKKAISLNSTDATAHRSLGAIYFKTNRPEEARRQFLKTIELSPNARFARLGLAAISYTEGKTAEALDYVEQAIGKGITFEQLEKDEDLAPLRALPEWKELMKKYFPDKVKD